MLYRFRITLAEYGADEDIAERVLDAFCSTHPEVGAVVAQDIPTSTLTLVFSLEAEGADAAIERGREVFAEGGAATGLPLTEILELNVALVPAADAAVEPRELQPA